MKQSYFIALLIVLMLVAAGFAVSYGIKLDRCRNTPATSLDRLDSTITAHLEAEAAHFEHLADSLQYAVNARDYFIDSLITNQHRNRIVHHENIINIIALPPDGKLNLLTKNLSSKGYHRD